MSLLKLLRLALNFLFKIRKCFHSFHILPANDQLRGIVSILSSIGFYADHPLIRKNHPQEIYLSYRSYHIVVNFVILKLTTGDFFILFTFLPYLLKVLSNLDNEYCRVQTEWIHSCRCLLSDLTHHRQHRSY